jgi:protein-S-isoprenylcysteine O-methyltransferase Ste14
MVALSLGIGLWLARRDPGLLAERLKPPVQRRQDPADRRLMSLFMALLVAWLVLIGLDARQGWSDVPVWVQGLGAALLLAGIAIGTWVLRENSFAATVVAIQDERGQRVVSTGPYALVRHPFYVCGVLFFVGPPLLMGSWWGLAVVPAITLLLAVRIGVEERVLRRSLPGYDTYAARVRYRLVPGVW